MRVGVCLCLGDNVGQSESSSKESGALSYIIRFVSISSRFPGEGANRIKSTWPPLAGEARKPRTRRPTAWARRPWVLWPSLAAVLLGGLAVGVLTQRPGHRWIYTVDSTTVRLSVTTPATVQPGVRYWMYFGRTIALTAPTTPDACHWFSGQPDPAARLGPVKTLQAVPGLHVTAGTVLAKADADRAQQALTDAGQELEQASTLLAADEQAALDLSTAPVAPPLAASSSSAADTAAAQSALPPSFAANAQIRTDQERVAAAQQQQATAAQAVQDATITAPVDGVVEQVGTATGGVPSCGTPVLVMRSDLLQLHAGIPQDALPFLSPGQRVDVTFPGARLSLSTKLTALPLQGVGAAQKATLPATAISPILQAVAAPTYPLTLPLPSPLPDAVLPGMSATTTFRVTTEALAVPSEAVHYNASRTTATVLRCSPQSQGCADSAPTAVHVRTGLVGDALTEITAGLSAGDVIVTPHPPAEGLSQGRVRAVADRGGAVSPIIQELLSFLSPARWG